MREQVEYLLLGLLAFTLILVSGYTQWISIDLALYSLSEYAAIEFRLWDWWTAVGFPFLAGITYLGLAIVGIKIRLSGNAALIFFAVCLGLAMCLLSVSGSGLLATVYCALILLYVVLRQRKLSRT